MNIEILNKYKKNIQALYEKWGLKFIVISVIIALFFIYFIIYGISPTTGKKIFAYLKYNTFDTFHTQTSYFFNAGVKYEELGLHNLAIGSFKRALHFKGNVFKINPNDPYQLESLYNLGVIYYMHKKNYPQAMHYFNKYLEIFPKGIENPHAEDIYKVVNYILELDDKTKNAEAKKFKVQGNKFYFRKDYTKAIEYYMKALALDPGYVEVYNNLGTVYLQMNDFEKAVKYWKIALMLDPDELYLYINTALALDEKLKKYDEAIYYYEQFIKKAPKNDPRISLVQQRITILKEKISREK